MQQLQGRVAVITGAASGIGLAIARAFLSGGDAVMLADRDPRVNDIVAALRSQGRLASARQVDLSDPAEAVALARAAETELGACDVLINNAGISPKRNGLPPSPFDIGVEDWELTLRTNLTTPFVLCRELLPGMVARRFGRVVNIASRAGRTGVLTGGLPYAASKAGLIGMTRALALQCAAQGITANSIAPGWVETPLTGRTPPAAAAKALQAIPLGRVAQPDEIAGIVAFLCSADAAYITGAVIDANGGSFMG